MIGSKPTLVLSALLSMSCVTQDACDRVCAGSPVMATIPAGSFEMGEWIDRGYGRMDGPKHTVRFEKPFALAVHEVTLGEFRAFVKATGYISKGKCNVYENGSSWHIDPARNWADPGFPQEENHPVVCVSWRDAQQYIKWLNGKMGRTYRLPSEAEWEYVASLGAVGGANGVTYAAANIGQVECCGGKAEGKDRWIRTAPVGSFPSDQLGLYDIRGNVWEWQEDCYNVDFNGAPGDGSPRTQTCSSPGWRVVRGGSYGDAGVFLEEQFRLRGPQDQAYFTLGFRLAQTLS